MHTIDLIVGALVNARFAERDERGLTQSTENAILLAGAAGIAVAIIAFIGAYVADRMPNQ